MKAAPLLFALLVCAFPAQAQLRASPPVAFKEATIRLLAERDARGMLAGALEVRLMEGYKTYWKNPGDSGAPPLFDFSASTGLSPVEVAYPLPQGFDDGAGGTAIGYKQAVLFPFSAQAASGAVVRLKLDFAVCGTLCIPLNAELVLEADKADLAEPASLEAITQARAALPRPATALEARRSGENRFTLRLPYSGAPEGLEVFTEAPAFFEVKDKRVEGAALVVELQAQPQPGKATLGPLNVVYGRAGAAFEARVDVDSLR